MVLIPFLRTNPHYGTDSNIGASKASLPVGVSYSNFIYTLNPGAQIGVYQKLSSRAGGEVLSSDSY